MLSGPGQEEWVATPIRAGELFAGRYRLTVLLDESGNGRFWRARDEVLARSVALHLVETADPRADTLMEAARRSARVQDQRLLRVLDADRTEDWCWVVNEWGEGVSLDLKLADTGPLSARRAAWLVQEFADTLATAHAAGQIHGRVVPENLLIDASGQVRVIGLGVDAALRGEDPGSMLTDVADSGALLYAALTGRWVGRARSQVPSAPRDHGVRLRARQVQAGVPRTLDLLCEHLLTRGQTGAPETARALSHALAGFVGDPSDLINRRPERPHRDALRPVAPRPAHPDAAHPHAGHRSSHPEPADPDEIPAVESTVENLRLRDLPPARQTSGADPDLDATAAVGAAELLGEANRVEDPLADLSWLTPRTDSPPAPELPQVAERPLFAPEPTVPVRVRPPQPPPVPAAAAGFTGAAHGLDRTVEEGGGSHQDWPWDKDQTPDTVPGRRWFRLAVVVGVLALVLLCSVAIQQVLGHNDSPGSDPSTSPTNSAAPAPVVVENLKVTDFDPEGTDGGSESPSEVPLATDGNPATAWRTAGYYQNFTDRNRLKTGVGLLVDLGQPRDVAQVTARVLGGQTSASVYLFAERPVTVQGATPIAKRSGSDTLRFPNASGTKARWVVVWLTSVPFDGQYYRGQIAELRVLEHR